MHARWAAMRRRRMRMYPVVRRTVRRGVQRGVDRGQPGRPSRVRSVRHVDDEGDGPDDDVVSAPMTQAASRSVAAGRFGRAGRERGGFRHGRGETLGNL